MENNIIDESNINPFEDGITHINVYSKARTLLGQKLSNFAHSPFNHPKYGKFESVEGFWYWILTGKVHEELKELFEYEAKKKGQEFETKFEIDNGVQPKLNRDDIEDIHEAIRCKLRENKDILKMLIHSDLPLVHYYCWYGKEQSYKVDYFDDYYGTLKEIERIRKICQEKYFKD